MDLACRTALRRKYLQIARLRHPQNGSISPADARRAMRTLASEFPGSLRELDALPMEAIEARLSELDETHDTEPATPWMRAQLEFHALVRGALVAKKWTNHHPYEATDAQMAFASSTTDPEAAFWANQLSAVANPPAGRLISLVFRELARRLALSEADAKSLVFGLPTV